MLAVVRRDGSRSRVFPVFEHSDNKTMSDRRLARSNTPYGDHMRHVLSLNANTCCVGSSCLLLYAVAQQGELCMKNDYFVCVKSLSVSLHAVSW